MAAGAPISPGGGLGAGQPVASYNEDNFDTDGIVASFALSESPDQILGVYLNGQRLNEGAGNDYQVSGSDVNFEFTPPSGGVIIVHYFSGAIQGPVVYQLPLIGVSETLSNQQLYQNDDFIGKSEQDLMLFLSGQDIWTGFQNITFNSATGTIDFGTQVSGLIHGNIT